jgi:Fe-S-cluster-containing dehydrogenase component
MEKVALIIDDEHCWGCRTCEVACKQENNAPDGVRLISIREDGPILEEGKWLFTYRVNRCRHCEAPDCAESCPEGAIDIRPDGIVVLDEDRCTGCQACIPACPYNAIAYDPELGIARKCNLCHHRVDRGLLPACADNICLAHCIHLQFGNGRTGG